MEETSEKYYNATSSFLGFALSPNRARVDSIGLSTLAPLGLKN
jgi:hypothetical protein